ncbi:non-canonical purine NTP pyrophosphatase, RdgB/HAM1 family [Streptomyces sp. Ncost-T6T-2b]|nr:non-canonical purine NTP pyrophosphatase, RdgB/HAM1 family [Streptomyces sp. Ncost-T6T-2b]
MKRLILATRNAGKITELHAILADAGLDLDLVGADAYPDIPDVKETGVTFAENALLKAHALARATGLPAVADDSGLCVDVLGGAPGIFSARWSGTHGDDKANLDLLLAQLGDIDTPTGAPTSPAPQPWPSPTARNAWSRAASTASSATPRPAPTASATTRSSSRTARPARARS